MENQKPYTENYYGSESFVIGLFVNDLLNAYISIHDKIFKKNPKKLISNIERYPEIKDAIFELMDIDSELRDALKQLNLNQPPPALQEFSKILKEYIALLLVTIYELQQIIGVFISEESKFNKVKKYNDQVRKYQESCNKYISHGAILNKIKNTIDFNNLNQT